MSVLCGVALIGTIFTQKILVFAKCRKERNYYSHLIPSSKIIVDGNFLFSFSLVSLSLKNETMIKMIPL
jgi:hypothetical protein